MTSLGRAMNWAIGVIVWEPHEFVSANGYCHSSPKPAMPRANAPWSPPEKNAAWLELATVLVPSPLA